MSTWGVLQVVKRWDGEGGEEGPVLSSNFHPKEHSITALLLHPTVISRNILIHKDVTKNWETPEVESRLGGPPGVKSANGSTRTLLEKTGGKPGPGGLVRTVLHADEM